MTHFVLTHCRDPVPSSRGVDTDEVGQGEVLPPPGPPVAEGSALPLLRT